MEAPDPINRINQCVDKLIMVQEDQMIIINQLLNSLQEYKDFCEQQVKE